MPNLAIVRLDEKGARIPETCYILIGQKDNKLFGHRIIKGMEYGWDGVPAAWPYMVAGIIPALGIGFCIGELARRKFAIAEVSQKALLEANQIKLDAWRTDFEAQDIIREAKKLNSDLYSLKNRLHEELMICRAVTVNSEDKIRNCDEKLNEIPKVERELEKARNVIEKLNQRISRNKKGHDKKANG
ncbi:hypothetical protein [Geobacter argillaceus]|uniref:Uncharacterized protein n=1 Tax=Geobacter argillaceus TaxID=345631 RepID=A0A562VI49_9BACT|nr:hypothetical protein [Geobacter argillaceus]TWJ17540.1 hypothetical protein JN12_02935 [Geobacter argillaceus]